MARRGGFEPPTPRFVVWCSDPAELPAHRRAPFVKSACGSTPADPDGARQGGGSYPMPRGMASAFPRFAACPPGAGSPGHQKCHTNRRKPSEYRSLACLCLSGGFPSGYPPSNQRGRLSTRSGCSGPARSRKPGLLARFSGPVCWPGLLVRSGGGARMPGASGLPRGKRWRAAVTGSCRPWRLAPRGSGSQGQQIGDGTAHD